MQKGSGTSALVAVERRIGLAIESALQKRTPFEVRLAGVVRSLAPCSLPVRVQLATALKELVRRDAFDRELYSAGIRALADANDKKLTPLLVSALKADDFGGLPALSASCFVSDPALTPLLARAAASQKTQLAFAAEVARLFRGEPTGARLFALAARIKEAHRIALTIELLLPISLRLGGSWSDRGRAAEPVSQKACQALGDALFVLRGSERHLGRWLVMAEIAHRGGDERPLKEAIERTTSGPDSSRAAWSLVVWALDPARGTGGTRPTSELVARLSHRPSADRDTAFLFRMAHARLDVARPMLEALARTKPLGDEVALRASFMLAKSFDRPLFGREVFDAADGAEREEVRGLAAAALWDMGERERALAAASSLSQCEDLTALAWSALITSAAHGSPSKLAHPDPSVAGEPIVTEPTFRRLQLGWIE